MNSLRFTGVLYFIFSLIIVIFYSLLLRCECSKCINCDKNPLFKNVFVVVTLLFAIVTLIFTVCLVVIPDKLLYTFNTYFIALLMLCPLVFFILTAVYGFTLKQRCLECAKKNVNKVNFLKYFGMIYYGILILIALIVFLLKYLILNLLKSK